MQDIEWKKEWFLSGTHQSSLEAHKSFLENLKLALHIKEPKDWGKLTIREISQYGALSMLKFYHNSLFYCLQSIYPGI
jgi:hypothetical protein